MLKKIFLPKTKNRGVFFPVMDGKNTITFTKGINCIVGPNASGKTVLLKTLKWKSSSEGRGGYENVIIPTYVNCEYTYKAAFDEPIDESLILWYEPQQYSKFNGEAVQELFDKSNIKDALSLGVYRRSEAECISLYFSHWFDQHKGTIGSGKHVIVCVDEVENSNDPLTIDVIMRTFRNWCKVNSNLQILITTHSPIVLSYADHIIETKKGWTEDMRKLYLKVLTNTK